MTALTKGNEPEPKRIIKVALIAHFDAYYVSMFGLANAMKRKGKFLPILIFPHAYPNALRDIEHCAHEEIHYQVFFGIKNESSCNEFFCFHKRKLLHFLKIVAFAVPFLSFMTRMVELGLKMHRIRDLLTELSPSVIVLGGDIVGHDMSLYIKVAHDLKIKSVVVPGWMASAREAAEQHLYDPRYSLSRPTNWLFCKLFPNWGVSYRGKKLIRLPANEALAIIAQGLAPPLPWILHSGHADLIAVESDAARQYGVREGLDGERIKVVGSIIQDVLHSKLKERARAREELFSRLGFDKDKLLIVCAVPPDMLSGKQGRPECEFSDYRELIYRFMAPIRHALGQSYVACIHPSTNIDSMDFITEYGAVITGERLEAVLPLADLYVASISATIQWAVACGVPVVNYDVYRYRYTDYSGLSGVVTIESHADYIDTLNLMINDPTFLLERKKEQLQDSGCWGKLDGGSEQRILEMLINLSDKTKNNF